MSHNSEGRLPYRPDSVLLEEIRERYADQIAFIEPSDLSPVHSERVIASLVRFLDTFPTDSLVLDSLRAASAVSANYRELMEVISLEAVTVLALPPEEPYVPNWTPWFARYPSDAYPFRADVRKRWGI